MKTTLGIRLKELRKKTQETQEEVAKKLGITRASYSHLETGRNEPDNKLLSKLAIHFKVPTDFLLNNESKNAPNWATKNDVLELDKFLDTNGAMTFEGVELNKSQKERVRKILIEVFWEELKKDRDKGVR